MLPEPQPSRLHLLPSPVVSVHANDTLCAVWKGLTELAALIRALGTRPVGGVAGAVVAVFAAAVLWQPEAIREALRAGGHAVTAEMVEPAALAVLVAGLCCVGLAARASVLALSPKRRLRDLAAEVSDLAVALTDRKSYYWDFERGFGDPLPVLEAQIAITKAHLGGLQIRSPGVSDGEAWRAYIPLLSGWVATGDLHAAREYAPEVPASDPAPWGARPDL